MKLAGVGGQRVYLDVAEVAALTVGGLVEDDEARVYVGCVLSTRPPDCVGVSAESAGGLVEEDIVVGILEGPDGGQAGAATADHGDSLPGPMC